MEEWRAVEGWPGYEVSNEGRVRSYARRGYGTDLALTPHPIKTRLNVAGYWSFRLQYRGATKLALVHRTVLTAFVGPCPEGMEACHNNGIRTDNRVTNLRWDTKKNNSADRKLHGTYLTGERSGASKLTAEQVRQIREARAAGEGIVSIGRRFGIGHSHVSRIYLNKVWA